jgi:hypothetical protein
MEIVEKVRDQFIKNGYVALKNYNLPKSLLWYPDLVLKKNKYIYLILCKTNNSIPPAFLSRISVIPKENIIPLIIFAQKLSSTDEKMILSSGISIGYFHRGRLSKLNIKKKRPKAIVKKEIKKKLNSIDIFISSKQDIVEREFIKTRIHYLRDTFYYPFFPHLIEYEKFSIIKLFKHIDDTLANCDWIIILLEDKYSDVVHYEVNKSLKVINHDNIFMFVKSTAECRKLWKKELNKIKKLDSKTIKYLPYSNTVDLEVTLSKAINKRMNEICKNEKVQIFI